MGAFLAGDRTALHAHGLLEQIDFGYPVIYLPIDPQRRCRVRFKARYLLSHQRRQIGGAFFTGIKEMSILKQIPEELVTGNKEFQIR